MPNLVSMNQMTIPSNEVRIPSGSAQLYGDLALPPGFAGVVLFAHGSGSGRHSARNRQVARHLQQAGIATLLFDLLTAEEEKVDMYTREHRFDIPLLARRMEDATAWIRAQPEMRPSQIGYFGASTGSAAALVAASRLADEVAAVVSRGGRPDLAGEAALASVTAPTLLIVGGADYGVIELNREAYARLQCPKSLAIILGATHLFEETGALEQVSEAATSWFSKHLATADHEA
jgi:putative phosphoribosyl transferase